MEPTAADTSLLVLCGGDGRRMGGEDKPLLEWRGRCMVDHVLASVPDDMPKLISANRNLQAYATRGEVITDAEVAAATNPGGPLTGVLGGLTKMHTEWLLVAPGDSPALPRDWWRTMFAASHNACSVVAHDGERQQNLHLLLHHSMRANLAGYLRDGRYEVYRWLAKIELRQAMFHNPGGFINVNQPGDLS